jgi:hypothetical protein
MGGMVPIPARPRSLGDAQQDFFFEILTSPTSPEESGEALEQVTVSAKVGGRVLGEDGRGRTMTGPILIFVRSA